MPSSPAFKGPPANSSTSGFWVVPNIFSLVRLSLSTSCFLLLTSLEHKEIYVVVLMTIAALSDLFDGYFARKLQQSSRFGAYLDLIADNYFMSISMLCFLYLGLMPIVVVGIFWLRDITISCARGYNALELGIPHKTTLSASTRIVSYVVLPLSLLVPPALKEFLFILCGVCGIASIAEYAVFIFKKRCLR